MCSYALFISQKHIVIVHVGKSKVTVTKEKRTTQAGCTTTTTERRAHRKAHLTAARNPAACIYFIAFGGMRFTHSAVGSKASKKMYLKERTTSARHHYNNRL